MEKLKQEHIDAIESAIVNANYNNPVVVKNGRLTKLGKIIFNLALKQAQQEVEKQGEKTQDEIK